jgi:hypothetical protein
VAVPPLPSETSTVITAVPEAEATGVTLTVRLAVEPPKTMLALGTSDGLEEVPVRVRLPAGVSMSPMVNESAAVAVP